jgi:uncharacterized membrane protein YfcA
LVSTGFNKEFENEIKNVNGLIILTIAGFLAQLIDGSMGMAFGVVTSSFLIFLAYQPALASAIVHASEVVTSLISGVAHIRSRNVDWQALVRVAIPGAIGAFLGAFFLSSIDLSTAKPITASILLMLGVLILFRFTRVSILGKQLKPRTRWLSPLGLFGGFIDSTGGGGWGPVVTTTLTVSNALEPRKAIGTANTAEFVIAISASLGFVVGLGISNIPLSAVFALIIGGALAAPIASWLVSKAPQRILGILVGNIVVALNIRQLVVYFEIDEAASLVIVFLLGILSLATLFFGIRLQKRELKLP